MRGAPRGTVEAARRFSGQLSPHVLSAPNGEAFLKALDRETIRLQAALPPHGRRWGVARKLLNIYIRDCVYSAHLRATHKLGLIEAFCEVPLDSITAKKLRARGRAALHCPRGLASMASRQQSVHSTKKWHRRSVARRGSHQSISTRSGGLKSETRSPNAA